MPIGPKPLSAAALQNLAKLWQTTKHQVKSLGDKEKEFNQRLSEAVENIGDPDDKGHMWLRVPPYEGWEKGKQTTFNALQRQRRVSLVMDEEEAARVLQKKGLLDQASVSYIQVTDPAAAHEALAAAGLLEGKGFEVVTSISEDAVRDLYYDDVISQDEYGEIFSTKVTWALLPGRL